MSGERSLVLDPEPFRPIISILLDYDLEEFVLVSLELCFGSLGIIFTLIPENSP